MKLVLLGYMASGKSAIGKVLATNLKIDFIDLDSYIEEKENLEISEIFQKKGEIYFRKKESEYLNEVLNLKKNLVISLGGGTPCYANNIEVIKEESTSFYLKASIQTIFERLKNETAQRPLVAALGIENLTEYIAKHLFERGIFYKQADKTIIVDDKSITEITNEIFELF